MSADMNHETFPSDGTLAAFIDGKLDPETRKRVLEHMSGCGECRDVVAMAGEFNEAQSGANVVPMRSRRWMLPAAAAAIAAAIVIALLTPIRTWLMPRQSAIASLAAVAPPRRTFEGRLADFPYRPIKERMRGAEDDNDLDRLPVEEAASRIRIATRDHATPDNVHALAIALLLLNDIDGATKQIQSALQAETGDADPQKAIGKSTDTRLLNDAAAIYAAQAERSDAARDRLLAFDAADRAHKLDPHSAEAAWNRALAIESLHLTAQAIAAWQEYLAIDSASQWANEARSRIQNLKATN